jgi:hypothetical protein
MRRTSTTETGSDPYAVRWEDSVQKAGLPAGFHFHDLRHTGIGTEDVLVRHRLEDALDRALTSEGIGEVDGGDIGGGTMNVFAVVESERSARAIAVAVDVLREAGLADLAIVACRELTEDDPMPVIVWPEGQAREFRY